MVEEDTRKGEPTSQAQSITGEELGRKGRQQTDLGTILQLKSTSMHVQFGKDRVGLGRAGVVQKGRYSVGGHRAGLASTLSDYKHKYLLCTFSSSEK